MKLICGLKSGALLQRDENNSCKCFFQAETNGEIKTSLGAILKNVEGYILTGIPTGGPYSFIISDDESEVMFTDVYVGDLWLLAGQSNMEGAGKMRAPQLAYDENPVQSIRAYYMNESWGVAKSQLHQLWESADSCISTFYRKSRKDEWGEEFPSIQDDGVGPGLYFALEMQKLKGGVPQGLIPCGIGGSALWQWNPSKENNYYAAAKRRFYECGGCVKGIFWYQGEAQCSWDGCERFASDMKNLVAGFRKDFGDEKLPFVQVQINKYRAAGQDADGAWTAIREIQRTLDETIDNMSTVYSNDCELDDLIHLSSESQVRIGKRGAEAMNLLTGGKGTCSPKFDGFEIVQDDYVPWRVNVKVYFKNLVGGLTSTGVPFGFVMMENPNEPIREIARIVLEDNAVRLKVEIDPKKIEDYYVCYAWGNTFYCNITDEADRAIPGFGPLRIKDYLRK